MRAIKTLCAKIRKTFFDAIDENTLSAAFMLGNLYLAFENADDEQKVLLNKTLQQLKEKLTTRHIQLLGETIINLPPRRLRLMRGGIKNSVGALKSAMLADREFFLHLPFDSLIKAGQHPQLYRDVMIAFIRKHLVEKNLPDSFVGSHFDYELMRSYGAEQNHLYMAEFIKACESLPVDNLIRLGSERSEIASLMLMDLKNSELIFEIGSRFARIHPSLRQEISECWQSYFETFPITSKQAKYVKSELPKLKKAYPEFSEVSIQSRVKRNYQVSVDDPNYERFKQSFVSCFKLGFILSLPANVYTLPIFVGYGIHSMYSFMNERNKASIKRSELIEPRPIKAKLSLG